MASDGNAQPSQSPRIVTPNGRGRRAAKRVRLKTSPPISQASEEDDQVTQPAQREQRDDQRPQPRRDQRKPRHRRQAAHHPQISGDGDFGQPTDDRVVHHRHRHCGPTPTPAKHRDRHGHQGDQGQQPPQAASPHMTRQRRRLPGRPPSSSGRARHSGLPRQAVPPPSHPCRRTVPRCAPHPVAPAPHRTAGRLAKPGANKRFVPSVTPDGAAASFRLGQDQSPCRQQISIRVS